MLTTATRGPLLRLCSGIAIVIIAATQGPAEAARSEGSARIAADVVALAHDRFDGRATGSRGYDAAAAYVADAMRAAGLSPGAHDGWLQPVRMKESTRVAPNAEVIVRHGNQASHLVATEDYMPLPSYFSERTVVEAPMAFVGFATSAPEFGYDDFEAIDLRGKVAVFVSGLPRAIPAALRVFYSKEKARTLGLRGAVGSVEIPLAEGGIPPARWQTFAALPATRLKLMDSAGEPVDTYRGLDASVVMSAASGHKLFVGSDRDFGTVAASLASGRPASMDLAAVVTIRTQSTHRSVTSANVVGVLPGADPVLAKEHVVLMAHLDHLGVAAAVGDRRFYSGALDNAAGVAVMLEVARLLADSQRRPRRSIIFLATTAEERGLLGSRRFAIDPPVPKNTIVAAVNIDMPVPLYRPAGYTAIGADHSTLGTFARVALASEGLAMLPAHRPERGLFAFTDQFSFVQEGIPSLYLHEAAVSADASVDAVAIFESFLRDHYHKPSDNPTLPIDWDVLARLARINAEVCELIANGDERPSWLPGDLYGERFGRPGVRR